MPSPIHPKFSAVIVSKLLGANNPLRPLISTVEIKPSPKSRRNYVDS
jgi:hypothetical protein